MIITKTILFSIIGSLIIILGFVVHWYDKKLVKGIEKHEEEMQKKGHYKRHFIKDKK
jgi:hypothetical protein|tara:strand:+ start:45 stop:215 length:171 start_codon:yes stop_codon:yes gene_type:complete